MPQFQVGDKIKCINNDWQGGILNVGTIYTVTECGGVNGEGSFLVKLLEIRGTSRFKENRFVLAEPIVPAVPMYEYVTYRVWYVPLVALAEVQNWEDEICESTHHEEAQVDREVRWLEDHEYRILAKKKIVIKFPHPIPEVDNDQVPVQL